MIQVVKKATNEGSSQATTLQTTTPRFPDFHWSLYPVLLYELCIDIYIDIHTKKGMANIRKHANATMRNIYFDGDLLKAIKEKDPDFNLSAECNAMLKEKVELQKNEQAYTIVDPLGLSRNLTQSDKSPLRQRDGDHYRQSTLFETFASRDRRDEISRWVKSVNDTTTLNTIETNCKAMLGVAKTRRERIRVYA